MGRKSSPQAGHVDCRRVRARWRTTRSGCTTHIDEYARVIARIAAKGPASCFCTAPRSGSKPPPRRGAPNPACLQGKNGRVKVALAVGESKQEFDKRRA
jgi:hypothetical protein